MKASDDTLRTLRSNWTEMSGLESDQERGVPMPPQEKDGEASTGGGAEEHAETVSLIPPAKIHAPAMTVWEALGSRVSRRKFADASLTLEQLSAVLYATQGVRGRRGSRILKTAPSGGARHPFELYLVARRVGGVSPGLYRYRASSHDLVTLRVFGEGAGSPEDRALDEALRGQLWDAAAYLILTAIPYRTEWRYPGRAGKLVAMDAGHAFENTYLICEALGLGTCAIGAYDQSLLDGYLGVDGAEELAVYAAPVGIPASRDEVDA